MDYYLILLLAFALGFFLTELYKTLRGKRRVVVSVKHSDGTVTNVEIIKGRDPEFDALVKQAKSQKPRVV